MYFSRDENKTLRSRPPVSQGSWVRSANYVEREIAESFVKQVNLRIEAISKGIAENSEATER